MLKIATTILIISVVLSVLFSIFVIISPETIGGSTLEARSGKTLESIQEPEVSNTIIVQTRHIGVFALTTSIALCFILFAGFKKGEQWAWWAFLIILVISEGYGLALQIIEGDVFNMILHLIVTVLWLTGILMPVKVFFPKKSS